MLNRTMIIGRLGADPELRYTANGAAVANFSVATSRKYENGAGEKIEETEWFSVVAWQRLAETVAEFLGKGRLVYVDGRMQTRSWDDSDGNKRYKTELVAQEVKFLDFADDNRGGGGGSRGGGPAQRQERDEIDPDDLPF